MSSPSKSVLQCVHNFCMICQSQDAWKVGNCEKTECALHSVRPNQGLMGKQPTDYDLDEIEQQVLDNLNFQGLKEILDGSYLR